MTILLVHDNFNGACSAWVEESDFWTVMAVEGACAKLTNDDYESRIVDTASWNFVKAEAVE